MNKKIIWALNTRAISIGISGLFFRLFRLSISFLLIAPSAWGDTTTPPSSACHITDGTFTTCPDGSKEWDGIPAVGFSTTNAYLYADQADLSPLLATQTSPFDTLMLLYDECNRTTPLGPNEYVRVNFNTVEKGTGKEELQFFTVHLFGDGTIVFIKDGVASPEGRTTVIQGQRGKVGFGKSPNCNFDHVVAEYQIELDAASGHSYSPDPLFWGGSIPTPQEICGDQIDNDGNGQIDEGCPPPPPPQFTISASAVPPFVEFQTGYNIFGLISDTYPGVNSITVKATETVGRAGLSGDHNFDPFSVTVNNALFDPNLPTSSYLIPSNPNTGTVGHYIHRWDHWLGILEGGGIFENAHEQINRTLLDLFADFGLRSIFAQVIAGSISAADEFVDLLVNSRAATTQAIASVKYTYVIDAIDDQGRHAFANTEAVVSVPQYKKDELSEVITLSLCNATISGLSTLLTATGGGIPIYIGLPLSWAQFLEMETAWRIAEDPDANYTQIAFPEPLISPTLNAQPTSSGKQLALALLQVQSYKQALATTLGRYEGAREAGDASWMMRQLQVAREYNDDILADLPQIKALTKDYIDDLSGQGLKISATDIEATKQDLLNNGLPDLELSILSELGYSSDKLASLANSTAKSMDFASTDWQSAMRSSVNALISASGNISAWIEQSLKRLTQSTSELTTQGGPSGSILGHQAYVKYDENSNRLIVYFASNGLSGNPPSETWVLTNANGLGGSPTWMKLASTGLIPASNGLSSVEYDSITNRLIVYGGCFANCSPALSDTYILSNANGLGGNPVWSKLSVTNPQARASHSIVFNADQNKLIAFAGHFAFFGTDRNDVRVLSNANGSPTPSTWQTISPNGSPPGIRSNQAAVYDHTNDRMIVVAGTNLVRTCCPYIENDYNDIWILKNASGVAGTPEWVQLQPVGSLPPRGGHAMVYDATNNRVLIYGGYQWDQNGQTSIPLNDLWQLSNANGIGGAPVWTQISPSGITLPASGYPSAAFDSINGRLIIFDSAQPNRVLTVTLGNTSNKIPEDRDRDAISDDVDNCPSFSNNDQKDSNFNGIGDACENPSDLNFTSAFLKALPDGSTFAQPWPLPIEREPDLIQRLASIVEFRVESGLSNSPVELTSNLVNSLVKTEVISQTDASGIIDSVVAGVNVPPAANAGIDQVVRLGSLVTLNGSSSSDPDNGPFALSYSWTQPQGPAVNLTGSTSNKPTFKPTQNAVYRFELVVFDGASNSQPSTVNITVPILGDIDLDGDVDSNDLAKITAILNKPASNPNDLRDINGDMKIDALDSRKLVLLCTRPRCATQ